MPDCPTYVAPDHFQLGADGGKYGGVNCTASAAARTVQEATCGKEAFTGAQVRAASDEPIPDPKSPGLNLDQVDRAVFKLTAGRVNFDTRRMYDADDAIARCLAGEPMEIQYQRSAQIALGLPIGTSRFGGGHAASVDGVGGLHLSDNLVKRFPLTAGQLRTLLGSLVIDRGDGPRPIGAGVCYVAFGPDNTADWHIQIPKGGGDGKLHAFGLWTVDRATRTVVGRPVRRYTGGLAANSTRATTFHFAGHQDQSLCVVLDHGLAAEAKKRGVTYAVHSGYALKGKIA